MLNNQSLKSNFSSVPIILKSTELHLRPHTQNLPRWVKHAMRMQGIKGNNYRKELVMYDLGGWF